MMKKRYFPIKKSTRNDDDPKSDEKHLQTRFPTPPFGQQVRFFILFCSPAARGWASEMTSGRCPGGVQEVCGRCAGGGRALQMLH